MIGLALRIAALMVATLLLVTMTILGAFYLQGVDDSGERRAPLPQRIDAIVWLLEHTAASDATKVLHAASTTDFQLALRAGPLAMSGDASELPRVARVLQHSLGPEPHRIWVGVGDEREPRRRSLRSVFGRDGMGGGQPLHIAVELRDGRVLDIDVRGVALRRVLGRPFALAVLLLVGAIGLAALWALRSQLRPIEALAREVERVGTAAEGPPLPERGAREVRQLVGAFNRMRERIHLLIEGRTRMLAAISHDLGTYLTRLRLRIELIEDPGQRARAERDLGDMQLLLRDSLALARADQRTEHREQVDLVALARRECDERRAGGTAVPLDAPAELSIRGDAVALARVLGNLVGNAVRYAGHAELRIARDAGFAEITVDDRGPGIPAAEREAVLEPFYRRDTARNLDDGGSGLGLAIVADIVRRHGGELRLEDRPGGGLRVRVRLPVATDRGQ
ncbi:ATP-binding protein [Solimonas terrae]|uniref:histidine kinase n=1 Tax=Solimonas terrae TaxID=1396819 RepID=A0A6M2BNU1_9GAMM|nr:ATP-binding protein [Solimonas terrae]NGY03885.1 HAMP domain-containing protein [Solimonas terrae]